MHNLLRFVKLNQSLLLFLILESFQSFYFYQTINIKIVDLFYQLMSMLQSYIHIQMQSQIIFI